MGAFHFGVTVAFGTFGLFHGLRALITGEIGDALLGAAIIGAASCSIYGGLT